MITPTPRYASGDRDLGRRQYLFVGGMLFLSLIVEVSTRVLHGLDMISGLARDGLGLVTYVPLVAAMLLVHRYIRYATFARFLFTVSVSLLFFGQLADFRENLPGWPPDNWTAAFVEVMDEILYASGAVLLLSASYYGLLEAESGHQRLARKRELLETEIEDREYAEEESRRSRAELAQRVRERTAELAERNRQLAEQLTAGERIRAELEKSHNLLRQTEQTTKCGAWEMDVVTETVSGTEELWRIFEVDGSGPMPLNTLFSCFPSDALRAVLDIRRRALEECTPWETELPFVGLKGTHRWVRTIGFPSRGPDGNVRWISGTVQDVTDRKSTQLELHESESMLHAVIRSAPIFLWALDREGRITLNTGLGLAKLGFAMGRNVGKSVFELYPENSQVVRLARRAIAGESCSEVLEHEGLLLHATYSPLYDGRGHLEGAIGVAIDVTRERAFESRVRAKQKMEAIGALAGGIAHDFNNILYAMDGFAALAIKEAAGLPRAVQCIEELRAAGARATELIDRILSFSRQDEPRRESVDLADEVRNCARMVESGLPDNVTLQLDLDPATPRIVGDPAQIQQVLLNLTANARHAMREHGGVMRISLRPRDIDMMNATGLDEIPPGVYAELKVSDTGTGIDPQVATRLFEPFFTTKPVGEGTGLGLAIVQSVVEAHRGKIHVESEPGKGTAVSVLFQCGQPLENVPPAVEPEAQAQAATVARRVMVVDDEPQIRIFLRLLLEDAGHDALCYRNGEEALAAMTASGMAPDVAVVDLIMPGMSGVELSHSLRQAHPALPIILCSGHAAAERSPEVRALNAAAFVRKPVDTQQLLALISKVAASAEESIHT